MLKLFGQSSEERIKMITEGDLLKTFLFLSMPGFMMVFIQAVMPIIDGLFVYNFDTPVSGAAISYCGSLQSIFTMGLQGLSIAGSAIIGQTNGTGDKERARNLSGQLLALSATIGGILIPLSIIIGRVISADLEPDLKDRILIYNLILSVSLPFIGVQSSFNSIKNVFGHPEITFLRTLIFVPLKLFFTFLFVAVLRLGITGAAFSAFCAYFCIMFFIVFDLFVKKSEERLTVQDLRIKMPDIKKIARFSWPSVLQNSLKSLGFFLIKVETAVYGNLALSGQSIANDVCNIFQSYTSCYDAAIVSTVSINAGAGNSARAKKSAYLAIKLGIASSVFLSAFCMLAAPYIIRLYTKDPAIYDIAVRGSYIMALGFSGFSVMFNEMPAFIGLGLTKPSLLIQTVRIWVIRPAVLYGLYFFVKDIGLNAVFISFTASNLIGGVVSHLLFMRVKFVKRI